MENIFIVIAEIMEEEQVKRVKKLLEGWRMALLPLKSVLLWEQRWHPCAILLSLSILFFAIWLIDLSTIATFVTFGLLINFIDLIVLIVCKTIGTGNSWSGQKEIMFEDLCRDIVISYNELVNRMYSFYSLRQTCPSMYYFISITLLLTTAMLVSSIDTIFLLYLLSIVVLLMPGIKHSRCFENIFSYVYKAPKAPKSE